jgi:hypothetical protein
VAHPEILDVLLAFPKGSFVNTVDINRRPVAVNWDIDEFMTQLPHGERLQPKIY